MIIAADAEFAQAPATKTKHIPGQPDMWFFVLFETLIFTAYFSFYLLHRGQHETEFLREQSQLALGVGVLETIVLLTSSWSVARCVQRSRAGDYDGAQRAALVTGGLGVVFMSLKVGEWVHQIHQGNTFTTSEFFQFYFFLTAIHLLHLLIGFIVVGVMRYQLSSPQRRSQELVETCATYWHTVDYLWVLIFALVYVVR